MKRKILWLASWYPNKHEPLSGDFIERHAKAASLLNDITVIHVVKDHTGITSGKTTIVKKEYADYSSLRAVTCYYKSRPRTFSSLFSIVTYFNLQRKLIRNYIKENGKPDLINVHISFKAGLGALYAKWRYGIRYVVAEQWTVFCPEAKPSFAYQPATAKLLISKIYKNASGGSAVSQYLAQSLADQFKIATPVRIPNVVDTNLFYPRSGKHDVFTFIHISVLNYQKSPEEIIEAIRLLKAKTARPFRFIIYGPSVPGVAANIKQQQLHDVIEYRTEVMQDELSVEVAKCHSLVLYSRFETFGCVVIEALASGLPVIVSDIPVMHELVRENHNGIFAEIDNPESLANSMLWMMENYAGFDQHKIAAEAKEQYAFANVATKFDELYRRY